MYYVMASVNGVLALMLTQATVGYPLGPAVYCM